MAEHTWEGADRRRRAAAALRVMAVDPDSVAKLLQDVEFRSEDKQVALGWIAAAAGASQRRQPGTTGTCCGCYSRWQRRGWETRIAPPCLSGRAPFRREDTWVADSSPPCTS